MTEPVELDYRKPGLFSCIFMLMLEKEEYNQLFIITRDGQWVDLEVMRQNWYRSPTLWATLQILTDQEMLAIDREQMRIRIELITDVTAPIITNAGLQKFLVSVTLKPIGV